MDWQPIDTAPMDGTWVLLTGGTDDMSEPCAPMVSAFWHPDFRGWIYASWDMGWRSQYVNPTHWKPLPEPPA